VLFAAADEGLAIFGRFDAIAGKVAPIQTNRLPYMDKLGLWARLRSGDHAKSRALGLRGPDHFQDQSQRRVNKLGCHT
jgi:hypothetical protein